MVSQHPNTPRPNELPCTTWPAASRLTCPAWHPSPPYEALLHARCMPLSSPPTSNSSQGRPRQATRTSPTAMHTTAHQVLPFTNGPGSRLPGLAPDRSALFAHLRLRQHVPPKIPQLASASSPRKSPRQLPHADDKPPGFLHAPTVTFSSRHSSRLHDPAQAPSASPDPSDLIARVAPVSSQVTVDTTSSNQSPLPS